MTLRSLAETPVAGRAVLGPITRLGYRRFRRRGETPPLAFAAMRSLYGASPGEFDRLAQRSTTERTPEPLAATPSGLAAGDVRAAVDQLREAGYFVLRHRVAVDDLAELTDAAQRAPCTVIGAGPPRTATFAPNRIEAPRYDLAERDIVAIAAVQRLLADESLLAVAQNYLGGAPVQDMVAMWWSAAWSAEASTAAAQLFHFDLDRLRFLKIFVYVTDVDLDTGPHVYVPGTHRALPRALRSARRYTDAEVATVLGTTGVPIVGPAGTVFLADTRGLHKGLPVEAGFRLVFQMEYASSLFGTTYERPRLHHVEPALAAAMRAHPDVYSRFTSDDDS